MPLLTMNNVHKRFGALTVLNGINMSVEAGQVAAVIGPSGSGKSTLLRVINGLEPIEKGTIEVDGVSTASLQGLREVRKQVGMVFQQFNLFSHLTVGGNVMLAQRLVLRRDKSEAEKRARADSSSASPSRGRSQWTRASCFSTKPPRRSIRSWSARCSA